MVPSNAISHLFKEWNSELAVPRKSRGLSLFYISFAVIITCASRRRKKNEDMNYALRARRRRNRI